MRGEEQIQLASDEAELPDSGVAGRSARREAARKRDWRLQSTPAKTGFSKLVVTLSRPSGKEKRQIAEEKHWAAGADGERLLAESLARRCPDALLLHDRRMSDSRANIDHIAVAASGVHVIDAKRYHGKIKVAQPLFGASKLMIAGRDRTKLIDGLDRQVAAVQAAVSTVAPDVPVRGSLCFLTPEGFMADSGLPVLRTLKIKGYPLYYSRRLAKRLNGSGPVTPDQARMIHAHLASRFEPA